MKKKTLVLASFPLLLCYACSDDSSNGTALETGNPDSVSYGIVPVDTSKKCTPPTSTELTDDYNCIEPLSKTEYVFRTENTNLFTPSVDDKVLGYISAFYEEKGLRYTGRDNAGSYSVYYRLMEKDSQRYIAWLWSNTMYRGEDPCEDDLKYFQKECLRNVGEFVDYIKDECAASTLSLSCVMPLNSENGDNDVLDSIALDLNSFVLEKWSVPVESRFDKEESAESASSASP
ncbi:MAG: hypothetical protein IKZ45_05840 [Fibrobacter sp.]|nr:hypothetical protein [Fibrobacter sp.]